MIFLTFSSLSQARRNEFRNGEAERSEESERSELLAAGGLGGAVSPPGGVRGDSPEKILRNRAYSRVIWGYLGVLFLTTDS